MMIQTQSLNSKVQTFAQFMQAALYDPDHGYYTSGLIKLGQQGDFATAPEISPLFSQCLARQCQQILTQLDGGDILEIGAGSGVMASDILLNLEINDSLPAHYYIYDVSTVLRQRQQQLLQQRCPHIIDRVVWLNDLAKLNFSGVILANEVLDAMPVHIFTLDQQGIQEVYVRSEANKLTTFADLPSSPGLSDHIAKIVSRYQLSRPYTSEINLNISPWLQQLNHCLKRGVILLVDYGFPGHEYYHPDRHMGTLMCHYQQQAHPDPLYMPGSQDITAHVDFTAVAEHASELGFDISGFATQANFLLSCGITDFINDIDSAAVARLQQTQQLKKLTMPHEMGELFKVLALSKGLSTELLGFQLRDIRCRLSMLS